MTLSGTVRARSSCQPAPSHIMTACAYLVQGIGEVCEKQVHDLGVDARHHQGDVVAGVRAHGGEDVGPLVADLTRPGGTLAPAPPPVTYPTT